MERNFQNLNQKNTLTNFYNYRFFLLALILEQGIHKVLDLLLQRVHQSRIGTRGDLSGSFN